jgi:hypothetical protein
MISVGKGKVKNLWLNSSIRQGTFILTENGHSYDVMSEGCGQYRVLSRIKNGDTIIVLGNLTGTGVEARIIQPLGELDILAKILLNEVAIQLLSNELKRVA